MTDNSHHNIDGSIINNTPVTTTNISADAGSYPSQSLFDAIFNISEIYAICIQLLIMVETTDKVRWSSKEIFDQMTISDKKSLAMDLLYIHVKGALNIDADFNTIIINKEKLANLINKNRLV